MTIPDEFAAVDGLLDLHVELKLGGVWVDLADRLTGSDITITTGRQDQQSTFGPGSVTVVVRNNDGQLTPMDPRSQWFPEIDTGTALQIRIGSNLRFSGEIYSIVPSWPAGDLSAADVDILDLPGADDADLGTALVTISAAGILRRLSQGAKPLPSPLRRIAMSNLNFSHIYAYWPCEDGSNAQSAAPLFGGRPLEMSGFNFASDNELEGSGALPSTSTGAVHWHGEFLAAPPTWAFEMAFRMPQPPQGSEEVYLFDVRTSHAFWVFHVYDTIHGAEWSLQAIDGTGVLLVDRRIPNPAIFGDWYVLRLDADDTTGAWALNSFKASGSTVGGISGNVGAGNVGTPLSVDGFSAAPPSGGLSIGHVLLHDQALALGWNIQPLAGWVGETAGSRALRLTHERGVPFTWIGNIAGPDDHSPKMGPQRLLTLIDLLEEAAAVDNAILCEQLTTVGLRWRPGYTRYNQAVALTVDASADGISVPLEPVADDQTLRNDITVNRIGGSEAHAVDDASVNKHGLYDEQVGLNYVDDTIIWDDAYWRLHLGTWRGLRVAGLTIDFAVAPLEVATAFLALRAGDRLRVTDLPPQFPRGLEEPEAPDGSVDLIAEGWAETLSATGWSAALNCSPAGPWTVAVWGSARYSPTTSGLHNPVDATTLTFDVDTPLTRWVTPADDPTAFPFDIRIGGCEIATVTGVTGTGTVQTFTVASRDRARFARAHPEGAPVELAQPAVLAL